MRPLRICISVSVFEHGILAMKGIVSDKKARDLQPEEKQFYLDLLRTARAVALEDAEGFQEVVRFFELIGQQVHGSAQGLAHYKSDLCALAEKSPLSSYIGRNYPAYHTNFSVLFDEFRRARNEFVHEGAHARNLTDHAVELALVLEDALMSDASMISQYMVRDVVEAKPWQPISFVRQQMLKHSFSYLPVRLENTWHLIAEWALARYLRCSDLASVRRERLVASVSDAVTRRELCLLDANTVDPEHRIGDILKLIETRPLLIVDPKNDEILLGLLTPSDVL